MYQDKTIVIDQEKVNEFCRCVNDFNSIHSENYSNPIVPGMLTTSLMFEKPGDFWRLAKMDVKYSYPVFVGIPVVYQYLLVNERSNFKKYKVTVIQENKKCLESDVMLIRKE